MVETTFDTLKDSVIKAYNNPISAVKDTYNSNTENGTKPAYLENAVLGAAVGVFSPAVAVLKGANYLLDAMELSEKLPKDSFPYDAFIKALSITAAYFAFDSTWETTLPVGIVAGLLAQPVSRFMGGRK